MLSTLTLDPALYYDKSALDILSCETIDMEYISPI